ncbi:MAG: DNA primase, partial [Vicinamibacterales bacterium]
MARFPQSFVDDVRAAADIVQVIQDVVPLRRVGGRYVGLCPFHSEKTPSFQVNRERGFFHCFGCRASGDVFKFVELQDKLSFIEAVRALAQRFGVPIPTSSDPAEVAADAERETLLKMHEVAVAWFQQQLRETGGAKARNTLTERGLKGETVDRLRLGFAPLSRDGLKRRLLQEGFVPALVVKSGLVAQRDDGSTVDRFRNRLMIPIARESGSVVAFGGRALEEGYGPKYLNSPETPIYHKSNVLYGLHITKQDMRLARRAVLVEGYFDFAQALQGGLQGVVDRK